MMPSLGIPGFRRANQHFGIRKRDTDQLLSPCSRAAAQGPDLFCKILSILPMETDRREWHAQMMFIFAT